MSQSSSFTLTVGGTNLDQQLQFTCLTLLVDNPTNQYIFISQGNVWVPPNTHGRVIPMQGGQVLQALFQSPIGIPANIIIPGQFATLTALDTAMPASSGSLQPIGAQTIQQLLPPIVGSCGMGSCHYALPAGTHSLALVTSGGGALSIIGDNTNVIYFSQPNPVGYYIVPVDSAADLTVKVGSLAGTSISLAAVLDVQAMFITQNPNAMLNVNTVNTSPLINIRTVYYNRLMLASNAFTDLVTGISNMIIYIHEWHNYVVTATNSAIDLEDSAASNKTYGQTRCDYGGPNNMPLHGQPISSGAALRIHNSGNACDISGHIIYTQQ